MVRLSLYVRLGQNTLQIISFHSFYFDAQHNKNGAVNDSNETFL